jgi:transposase-like protein
MTKYSEDEKAMWLEDWKSSGMEPRAYARQNGINGQTFVNWVNNGKEATKFVEVTKQVRRIKKPAAEILIDKGDVKIHVPLEESVNLNTLVQFIGGAL